MKKVSIIGAGSWGTAQALLLHHNRFKTVLWGKPEEIDEIVSQGRENRRYLPGRIVPEDVELTADITYSLQDADLVVLAVPSQSVRAVLETMLPYWTHRAVLVNTAKGIEISTGMRLSQVAADVLGTEVLDRYAVLSGPSHAEEVARGIPTAVTVAATREESAFCVQDAYMSRSFRVYTNPDIAGVEMGGALKNIVAMAAGMVVGLGYGDNTVAALTTRGLTEIIRMGEAMGGDYRTFTGLSGMGDLVVTCCSNYSRNRRAGISIGMGLPLEEALSKIGMVVEGYHTTRVVHRLAEEMNIEMPITRACYNVLYNRVSPPEEVINLMCRPKKHEIEDLMR